MKKIVVWVLLSFMAMARNEYDDQTWGGPVS